MAGLTALAPLASSTPPVEKSVDGSLFRELLKELADGSLSYSGLLITNCNETDRKGTIRLR